MLERGPRGRFIIIRVGIGGFAAMPALVVPVAMNLAGDDGVPPSAIAERALERSAGCMYFELVSGIMYFELVSGIPSPSWQAIKMQCLRIEG